MQSDIATERRMSGYILYKTILAPEPNMTWDKYMDSDIFPK